MNKKEQEMKDQTIGFAQWLSDEGYENMYQDVDNDKRTWASIYDENYFLIKEAKRYSLEELYQSYLESL